MIGSVAIGGSDDGDGGDGGADGETEVGLGGEEGTGDSGLSVAMVASSGE